LVDGGKIAGILPESSVRQDGTVEYVVLGIGVNVNQSVEELPRETAKPPTSLRIELGRELERAPLLAAILAELERRYDEWGAPYRR
jgi:BirA family biotin operon repressor/biotin-[acetyl-CoA-carboxylase] ligase